MEVTKQAQMETLEEAAERLFNEFQIENLSVPNKDIRPFKLGFVKGAKWQAERMYSEEEVIAFHKWAYFKNRFEESDKTTKELLSEWFEQFKK